LGAELVMAVDWDAPFAEAFTAELHQAMLTTFLRGGDQGNFLGLVARSNTGLDRTTERKVAEPFYSVTLNLARAAVRSNHYAVTAAALPWIKAFTVRDSRTHVGHRALDGIILA
jgi:hypothetical protein